MNKKCKNIYFKIFILFCLVFFISSCQTNSIDKEELERENKKADSISIKLNSPELKAVNAELLDNPNSAELYDKRANIYISLKQFNEAVNDAKRAIKLDSTKADFYMTLVDAYYTQNNTRLAKELLEIIQKKFPENVDALLKLAEIYYIVKQYQKGIDYVNKALKINERLALPQIIIFLVVQMYHITAERPKAARTCRPCNPRHRAPQGVPRGSAPGTSRWPRSQS